MPHRLLSRTLAVCILPVLAFLLVQTALAQTDNGKEITKRAFVADTSAVEPGKAFHVGFHFQIVEGWHMYWRFAGGLGEPLTVVEWNLPPGWEAGPIEFPLPHAEKDKTGWTLYAYGHEVMFPVKITPPKKFTGEVTLRAKIKWQVCADVCLMPPGPEEVQIKLTAGAAKPANEALFSKWLGELPRTDEPPTKDVKFDLSGKKLSVRVGGLPADAKAEFFVIPPSRIKTSFEMDKHPGAETAPDGVRVFTFPFDNELPWSGLLVTTGADGTRKGCTSATRLRWKSRRRAQNPAQPRTTATRGIHSTTSRKARRAEANPRVC